ncbi:hypothetical protein CCR75_008549 [Bremia lactucae]|uniref:Uncharacterized protein n=1 Tax=Bremia lactucae TaxID=4779 RepID=A0A976IGK9_BRELC|nr:hypothetical protein CCR75_008549 [Bremia lactucae]
MEGYSKAGLPAADASEVVVKVLNDEIGPWRAAELLKNLESVNPELFERTRSTLYRYWDVLQLSLVDFEGGRISSMLGKGATEKAKERVFNCFSEYFKYAGQAAGREENSAYKSLMEIIENLGYGHVLDGILRSFSQPEINELLDNGRRIALDYLKKQHEKYNTPSAIIKAVPYWDKGLILMGQPFFRLRALCKTHVKVEDGAVSEVKQQSQWLIDQLDDWVFDKKLFFVMYPWQRHILAATVLEQLSQRWKADVASSIAMAQDYIKSMLEILELKGTWPIHSIEYHAFQDFIDLAFDKPIPVQIKEAFNGQEGVDELIYKLNNAF